MADAKKVKIGGVWYYVKDETARNGLSAKQDKLTFDTTPTANSANPVTSGGVKTALDEKAFIVDNTPNKITTVENDTPTNWGNLKNGVFFYDPSDQLIDKPSNYGILINTCFAGDVSQLWFTQSSGKIYRRSGNANGWASSWVEIFSRDSIVPVANGGTGGTDSGWLSLTNASVFDGSIAYRKIGKFVYVSGQSVKLKNALTTSSVTLGVMPDGYRPGKWSAFWAGRVTDVGYEASKIVFTAGGNIDFYKPASISQWNAGAIFDFSFMYMTN